jgi:RNA polymerase sigma-70 factor (ECF subfamily)
MADERAAHPSSNAPRRAASTPARRASGAYRDEADLVAALKTGRNDAFEQVVRDYGGRLLAVARRFVGDDDARDVVQDAFLSAFRAIGRFEGGSRLGTWLHRITVNAALMKLRTRRRHPEEPLPDDWQTAFEADGHRANPGGPWQPLENLEKAELRELVLRSIDRVPEPYRTVLLLRDIEGIDNDEAAELLGVNPGTVKTRLHRARMALRDVLDPTLRESA